jgi:hypothetical protein
MQFKLAGEIMQATHMSSALVLHSSLHAQTAVENPVSHIKPDKKHAPELLNAAEAQAACFSDAR